MCTVGPGLAQIHAAGLNMIRTGWWTGWDKFCDENGQPYERTLRTMEAYLMNSAQARAAGTVQCLRLPAGCFGGVNAFLDPEACEENRPWCLLGGTVRDILGCLGLH